MITEAQAEGNVEKRAPNGDKLTPDQAFEYPRDFLDNQFVYLVISPRAKGLSIGVNLNPVMNCTFQCLYCEIDRAKPGPAIEFDAEKMAAELRSTYGLALWGGLRKLPRYAKLPDELMQLRHVAVSGDGEPTLSKYFLEAMEAIVHLRAVGGLPFFKIVVVTNSTGLDRPEVQQGLKYLTRADEIWAKLDGGTTEYLKRLNGATMPLEKIMDNILRVAQKRPVIIQSLFPAIDGQAPSPHDIVNYAHRLKELKTAGAEIPLVQIYSATRPIPRRGCSHLPLRDLSRIAQTVRQVSGLRAEVY